MSGGPPICDWQTSKKTVKERGLYLLKSEIWSDCRFIVGTEPHQQVLAGHKLFLAMASPVFEAMFFGGMPEKDPIIISDVQPEAFKALLEYIYTDNINFTSFDQACELCYGAKKYMLPHLVEECTKYLWSDLCPKNACRAYEFAQLFEEPVLMEKCLQIIICLTEEVLSDPTFEELQLATVMMIFDQDFLNITSELDLFAALSRWADKQNNAGAKVPRLEGSANASGEDSNPSSSISNNSRSPSIRDCLMKIRFLTLTPQQFAEGPASSSLLTQSEKFAILMNISSSTTDVNMPTGFSKSLISRKAMRSVHRDSNPTDELIDLSRKLYCTRKLLHLTECMNTSVLDCAVTFTCDRNVCVYGIQVPAQVLVVLDDRQQQSYSHSTYNELLYAHLLDCDGSRLTYTHFTSRVSYRSLIDICFNRPVYIQKNKIYKVGVVLNKQGWYPVGSYPTSTTCNGIQFSFSAGQSCESPRDGLIRSIIFACNTATNVSSVAATSSDKILI